MTLYEITGTYAQLMAMLEDPEVNQEVLQDTMEAIEGELEIKAENYAKIIKQFESDVNGLKAEEARLKAKRDVLEKSISTLKSRLQEAMVSTGKLKFKTDLFSFNVQNNGGALPVIVDVDTSELPDELVQITEKPDLKAIGEFLKEHPNCEYAHYGERGQSLRIK